MDIYKILYINIKDNINFLVPMQPDFFMFQECCFYKVL